MKIGDTPAFPRPEGDLQGQDGMTYRQWLIGMIASGNAASEETGNAEWIVAQADAIIDVLEQEQQEKEP